jgi:hypothetical protein
MPEDRATGPDRRPTERTCPRCKQEPIALRSTCPFCGLDLEGGDEA